MLLHRYRWASISVFIRLLGHNPKPDTLKQHNEMLAIGRQVEGSGITLPDSLALDLKYSESFAKKLDPRGKSPKFFPLGPRNGKGGHS